MSHNFQICPIDFALPVHGDNDPYDIFAFKITEVQSFNIDYKSTTLW